MAALSSLPSAKWKVSLNFGDQLLVFDFVFASRFLSLRCGPQMVHSIKGWNIDLVRHFSAFAATIFTVTLCSPVTLKQKIRYFNFRATPFQRSVIAQKMTTYSIIITLKFSMS